MVALFSDCPLRPQATVVTFLRFLLFFCLGLCSALASDLLVCTLSLGVDLLSSFDAINKEHLWKVSDQSHTSNTYYPTKISKHLRREKKHNRHIADHVYHTGQCKRTGGCYNELVVAF